MLPQVSEAEPPWIILPVVAAVEPTDGGTTTTVITHRPDSLEMVELVVEATEPALTTFGQPPEPVMVSQTPVAVAVAQDKMVTTTPSVVTVVLEL